MRASKYAAAVLAAVMVAGCSETDAVAPREAPPLQANHVGAITGVTASPSTVVEGGSLVVSWTAPAGATSAIEYKVRFECLSSCSGSIGSEPQTTGTSVSAGVGGVTGSFRALVRVHTGSHDWYPSNAFEVQPAAPANAAPVLASIGSKSLDEGGTLAFTATATDDPAQTLTYSLSGAPAGASIDAGSGAFGWTPADDGVFTMTVRVSDNGSPALSAEEGLVATVRNLAPSVGVTAPGSVASGVPFAAAGSFSDAGVDDSPWSYSLSCDTQSAGQTGSQGGFGGQIVCYGAGSKTVGAGVTDKDGGYGSASTAVQVLAQAARVQIHPRTVKIQDKSNNMVSVTVFGGSYLDVMSAGTIRLGSASPLRVSSSDVDGDGHPDLVLHYERAAVGFQVGSQTFQIGGSLSNGTVFSGTDTVRVQ